LSKETSVTPHNETWEDFGKNIESFLNKHEDEFQKVDLIVGFTRGGFILATVVSTLLRDIFEETARKKPVFASLRPIPAGITYKTYSHPCFAMDSPMSPEEEADYRQLIRDIRQFKEKFHKTEKILNVIIVDDNLTGATRLFAYKNALEEKLPFAKVKTLAYTRLGVFEYPKLDYQIREYPPDTAYFIMPYHKDHGTFELPVLRMRPICLVLKDTSNFQSLYMDLRKLKGKFGVVKRQKGKSIMLQRGASVINLAKEGNQVVLNFFYDKYYPPKRCLRRKDEFKNLGTFEEFSLWSLCGLGAQKADTICFYCSSLNCNYDILKTVLLRLNGQANFEVHQIPESAKDSILSIAVRNWLNRFKESLPLHDIAS
jgi:hypothetical protein